MGGSGGVCGCRWTGGGGVGGCTWEVTEVMWYIYDLWQVLFCWSLYSVVAGAV